MSGDKLMALLSLLISKVGIIANKAVRFEVSPNLKQHRRHRVPCQLALDSHDIHTHARTHREKQRMS